MAQINSFVCLLIFISIVSSCKKPGVSVVSYYLVGYDRASPCMSEPAEQGDSKLLIVILKNNSNDTAYFPSKGGKVLLPSGIILNFDSDRQHLIFDDFGLIHNNLLLEPNKIDSFCIGFDITPTSDKIEFKFNYKLKNIDRDVSLFYLK